MKTNKIIFFICTFVYLQFRISASAQWEKTSLPDTTGRINNLFIWGDKLFAATDGAGIWVSNDKGDTWTAKNNGISGAEETWAFATLGNYLFAAIWADSVLYFSTDSGNTWAATAGHTAFGYFMGTVVRILAVNNSSLFAGTQDSGIYVSADTGKTWIKSNNGLSSLRVDAFAVMGSLVFMGGDANYVTYDNGSNWVGLPCAGAEPIAVIGNKVFFSGVVLSADTGKTGNLIIDGLPSTSLIYAIAVSGETLFLGGGYGMFMLPPNDTTWVNIGDNLGDPFIYCMATDDTYLYAGGVGGGIWRRNLSELVSMKKIKKDKPSIMVYPNPTDNSLHVKIQNANLKMKNMEFEIYGINGIATKPFKIKNPEFIIDTKNFIKGIYFYKLTNNKECLSTGKFIIH